MLLSSTQAFRIEVIVNECDLLTISGFMGFQEKFTIVSFIRTLYYEFNIGEFDYKYLHFYYEKQAKLRF